jgi:hypothetical protein
MAHERDDPAMIVRHRAHGADEIRDAAELAFRRFVAGRVEGNHGEPRVGQRGNESASPGRPENSRKRNSGSQSEDQESEE